MKKNILIIGLAGMIGLSAGFISCSPDYETEFNVATLVVPDKSQATVVFPLTGGSHDIEVQTNVPFGDWKAESNAEWCKLAPQKDKVIVSAEANNIYKQRLAEITISYGHQSYSITVSQFGLEPTILVGEDAVREGYIKTVTPVMETLQIPVATNLNLDNIIVPDTCDWVHLVTSPEVFKKTRANGVVQQNIEFKLDKNTDKEVRYCTVLLQSSDNYSYTTSFVIKQKARGGIVEIDEAYKEFTITAPGKMITIPFKLNDPENEYKYEITYKGDVTGWITPVPKTRSMRDASESFVIATNLEETERIGYIIFTSTDDDNEGDESHSFTVTVNQKGFENVPPAGVVNATAIPGAGCITLNWELPEEVDFMTMKITYHDPVLNKDNEIVIDDNTTTSYLIEDTYKCAGEYVFTIKTYNPRGMETENPVTVKGTSDEATEKERVPLTIDMLSANATEPSEGKLQYLVDNSTGTTEYYHTTWSAATSEAHYVQIDLKKPLQNLCFEYDGRRNGTGGGDVLRAQIMGSYDNDTWEPMGTETFTLPATVGGHGVGSNISGRQAYKYIRFIPEATRQIDPLHHEVANQGWWNMAKMYLYRIRHDEAWAQAEMEKNR